MSDSDKCTPSECGLFVGRCRADTPASPPAGLDSDDRQSLRAKPKPTAVNILYAPALSGPSLSGPALAAPGPAATALAATALAEAVAARMEEWARNDPKLNALYKDMEEAKKVEALHTEQVDDLCRRFEGVNLALKAQIDECKEMYNPAFRGESSEMHRAVRQAVVQDTGKMRRDHIDDTRRLRSDVHGLRSLVRAMRDNQHRHQQQTDPLVQELQKQNAELRQANELLIEQNKLLIEQNNLHLLQLEKGKQQIENTKQQLEQGKQQLEKSMQMLSRPSN
ncbi:e4bf7df9-2172-424d-b551-e0c00776b4b1 [Thermothielavioides terrestris]|nr:e4bf7df9-2172-424d-b551-e0c00776b4b1 [Thermothielavioides terrestris]